MLLILLGILLSVGTNGYAQSIEEEDSIQQRKETLARLQSMQLTLEKLSDKQREIVKKIQRTKDEDRTALQEEKESLEAEISTLNHSYEQIAIGGIDTDIFGEKETEFDWQTEIIQIIQPVIENLKVLTEKPRKIERLRGIIKQREDHIVAIDNALSSLNSLATIESEDSTKSKLNDLVEQWRKRKEENQSTIEMTEFQLLSLQGENKSWVETIKKSSQEFFSGRGLTLLVAFGAAFGVWLFMRTLLWLMRSKNSRSGERRTKTRFRLAAYAYSLLTSLLIVISVMVVFYTRGDVLLLGLTILMVAGAAIALRNTLPRFIAETKLLINIGALREGERVIYQGIPWKVTSLNLYSTLKNPEIDGVIRLPLSELTSMTSRPIYDETWFPHRQGDFVLMPSGKLAEIVRQTPDIVELRYGGGASGVVATAEMYVLDALNLTRNGNFGVASTFGIDYDHQHIALFEVAEKFKKEIEYSLSKTDFSEAVKDTLVDLKSAGASSIDYLIYVTLDSSAAKYYYKIDRMIQQSCIKVCNEQRWNIPFPQLTVHNADIVEIPTAYSKAG